MKKIEIRGRRKQTSWHEVSEEKATNYARLLLRHTGIKKNEGERYTNFLGRYIRGLNLEKVGL